MSKEVSSSGFRPLNFVLAISFFLLPSMLWAQKDNQLLYHKEISGGILVHTNGFGATGKYAVQQDIPITVGLDILYVRHPRETRIRNPYFDDSTPYVFGKQYSLFIIQPSFGSQQVLTLKVLPRDVRIKLNYSVGFDLAVLKPVFLGIAHPLPGGTNYRIEDERYDPLVHTNQYSIFGNSGFFEGFDELKLKPGASIKTGLEFQVGGESRLVQLVETGVMLDFFVEEIPIFAFGKNQLFFPNLFLQFSLGQRW